VAISNDAGLRNRLISKNLDEGRRKTDATSGDAVNHTEAIESPINSFTQAPSSADMLLRREGPLENLLKSRTNDSQNTKELTIDDLAIAMEESGETSGTIDGNYGPKTLEAKNLFQQEQIDALKLQSNTLPNTIMKAPMAATLARQTRLSIEGVTKGKEQLSSLSNTAAKSIDGGDTVAAGVSGQESSAADQ